MKVKVVYPILKGNEEIAKDLKEKFDRNGIFVFNLISSPGAGKTTFLEGLINKISKFYRIGVIVGDIEDSVDAQRLSKPNVLSVQLNTKSACHLDAGMIREGLSFFDLTKLDLLIIENVGNLVCPSDFYLGEDMKIVILSVTEGDDKPKKYPNTFFKADVVLINKTDLVSFTNFSVDKARSDIHSINPSVKIFEIQATKEESLVEFIMFLEQRIKWKKNQKPSV
ncbi:MAG: hydrogenase nickel incorporation protein HypB [Proteobacteria bacterium]|nr:hydrogenase nickel incorporation protein HypB [Pseudomonadota bacterium]